jgi:hypothetical protein
MCLLFSMQLIVSLVEHELIASLVEYAVNRVCLVEFVVNIVSC